MFSVEAENTLGYGKKKTSKKFTTHGGVKRLETDKKIKREGKEAHEVDHNEVTNNVPIMFARGMKVGQKKCLMGENGKDNPGEETALSQEAPHLRVNLTSEEADEGTHSTMMNETNVISKITPVAEFLRSSSQEPAWGDNTLVRDKSTMRYSLPRRNISVDCENEGKTSLLVSPSNESNNPLTCYPKGYHRRGCCSHVPPQHFERHISKAVNLTKMKLEKCEGSNSESGEFTNGIFESVKGSMSKDSHLGNTLAKRNIMNWDNNDFALCGNSVVNLEGKLQDDENGVHENEERTKGGETDMSTVRSAESVDDAATHGGIQDRENHQMGNLNNGDAATFDVVKLGNSPIGSHHSDDNILEYKNEEKNWEHSKMEGEACNGINSGSAIRNPVSVEGKSESIGSDIASPEGAEMEGTEKKARTVNIHPIAQGDITHPEEREGKREQTHNALRSNGTERQTLFSADIGKKKMLHSLNEVEIKTDNCTYRCVHHINRAAKVYSNVSTVNFLKNNVIFLRKRRGNNACKKDGNRRSCSSSSRNVKKEGDGKCKDLPKEHGVVQHIRNTILLAPKGTSIFVEKGETNGKFPSRGRKGNSSSDREKGDMVRGDEKEPTSPHLEGTSNRETSPNRLRNESRLMMKQGGERPFVVNGYICDFNEGQSSSHEKVLSSGYSRRMDTMEDQSSPLNWKFNVTDELKGGSSPYSIQNIDVKRKPCVAGQVGLKTDKTPLEKEKNCDNVWNGKKEKRLHFSSVKFGRGGRHSNLATGKTIQYKLFHVHDMFSNTHLGEPKGEEEANMKDRRTNHPFSSVHHRVVTAHDKLTTGVDVTQKVGEEHSPVSRSNHSDHIMNIMSGSKNQRQNDSMRSGHVRNSKNEFCMNGTNYGIISIPNWASRQNIQVSTPSQMNFTRCGGQDVTNKPFCGDQAGSEEKVGQGGNYPPMKETLLDRINKSIFSTNRKNEMDHSCMQLELENIKIKEEDHRRRVKNQNVKDVFPLKSGRTIFPLFTPIRRSDKTKNKKVFHIRNRNGYVVQDSPEMSPTVATNRSNDVHVNEFVKNKLLAKGGGECNFPPNCTTHMREESNVGSSNGFYYDRIEGSNNPYVNNCKRNEDKWRHPLDSLLKNCYKERRNNTTGEKYTNRNFIINRSRNNLKNEYKAFGISEEGTSSAPLANCEGNYTQEHSRGDVLKRSDVDKSCVSGRADQLNKISGSEIDVKDGEMGRTYLDRAQSEYHRTMCEDRENVKELNKQKTETNLCGKNNNPIPEQTERFNFFHSEHDLFNGEKLRLYFSKGKNALHNGIFKIRSEVGIFSIFKNFPFFEEGAKMSDAGGTNQESISYECRYNAELVCRPGGREVRDVAKVSAGAVDGGCTGEEDKNDETGTTAVNSQNGTREVHKIICGTSEVEELVCAGSDDGATGASGQIGSSPRSCSNGSKGRHSWNEFAGGKTSPGEGSQMSALSNQNDEVKDAKGGTLTEEDKCVLRRGDEEGSEISANIVRDDITNAVCETSQVEEKKCALFGKEQSDAFFCPKDGELRTADRANLGCSENLDLKRQKSDPTGSSNEMINNFEKIAERINFILDDTVEFFKKNLYVHNGYGSVKVYKEDTGWLGENTVGKWSRVYKINKVVCKGAHGVVFSAWRGEEGDDTGKQLEEKAEKDAGLEKENEVGEGTKEVEGTAGDSIDKRNDECIDEGNDKDSGQSSDQSSYDEENLVSLKIINLRYLSKENSLKRIMKEVHFLQICNHPNIVKYHESFFWPPCYLVIVCEFLSGGTLFDLYKKCGRITEDVLVHILDDVLKALNYLHNECPLCLVHRDIKPTNIVFSKSGVAKIVDFGSCEKVEDLKLREVVGTLYYISPEILKREKYNCSADIWSLGITIYESVMCALPWKGKKDIEESIKQIVDSSPKINLCSGFSKQFCFFVESCLQNNPEKRAKVAHLLGHKFLTKKRLLRRKPSSIFEIRDILKVNNGKRKNNIFRNFFKNIFFFNDKNKRRRNKALGSKSCEPEMFYQQLKRENFDFFEIKLRDENSRSLDHLHVGETKLGESENEEGGKEGGENGKAEPNVHDDGDAECAEVDVQRMNNLSSNYLDSKEDITKQADAA